MNKLLGILAMVSVTALAQSTGYLRGWYNSGNLVVCEYDTEDGVYAITIAAWEVCPVTITIPE